MNVHVSRTRLNFCEVVHFVRTQDLLGFVNLFFVRLHSRNVHKIMKLRLPFFSSTSLAWHYFFPTSWTSKAVKGWGDEQHFITVGKTQKENMKQRNLDVYQYLFTCIPFIDSERDSLSFRSPVKELVAIHENLFVASSGRTFLMHKSPWPLVTIYRPPVKFRELFEDLKWISFQQVMTKSFLHIKALQKFVSCMSRVNNMEVHIINF